MKLVSTTDFVIEQSAKVMGENNPKETTKTAIALADSYKRIAVYARFLKKNLKLEMFVPCDSKGNELKEPRKYKGRGNAIGATNQLTKEYAHYLKAKERILFEGCRLQNENLIFIGNHDTDVFVDEMPNDTIESLLIFTIKTDWKLTITALKELGL